MISTFSFPKTFFKPLSKGFAFLMSIALMALSAQLSIYLPNNPVPIIWYMNLMFLYGALKGSFQGTSLAITYLAFAFLGVPLLANGNCGPLYFMGPTGGYLLGMIPATFVIGYLCERGFNQTKWKTFLAFVLGSSFVYLFGVLHLSAFIGLKAALISGILPFMPGLLVKNFIATVVMHKLLRRG